MNAISMEVPSGLSGREVMTTSRLLHAYFTEAKYEMVRMLRTPAFAIPFLGLPVLLYLLFAVVIFGSAIQNDPQAGIFIFTGFAVFGVMGPGMFGFGMVVAVEREQGLLKLKRALPMPPAAYLLAKMFMALLFAAIVMLTMLAALPLSHLPITLAQALAAAAINIFGALPFCAIGFFLGVRTTSRSAPAFVNIVYQVMMHVSGLFYPLPKVLKMIAPIWPTYHLQQLVFGALGLHAGGAATHIALLGTVTVVLTALSVRRLSRVG